MYLLLTVAFFSLAAIESLPVGYQHDDATEALSTKQVMDYLVRYGYLPDKSKTTAAPNSIAPAAAANGTAVNGTAANSTAASATAPPQPEASSSAGHGYTRGEIPRAIGDFQDFMSLRKTGMLDSDTLAHMSMPRCGVEDKTPHVAWIPELLRRRRFVTEGSKWPKTAITYTLSHPSAKLATYVQKNVLEMAFNRWAEVSPLTFSYTDNQLGADLSIRFASLSHGDMKPFDGPGNTLAHAFFPSSGGDIHFDEDEAWAAGTKAVAPANSKSLLAVAIHEIGHSLGLKHSSVPDAIMKPLYQTSSSVQLGTDDVRGIQSLYGQCSTAIDTVFSWIGNGKTYFFKGANTWRFDDVKSESERQYPKSVTTQWIGVPSDVDEGFLWASNWVTYFFKGSQYYRYNDQLDRVESGYPKPISTGWTGIPDDIDAAFSMSSYVSYFFKGSLCYKFDSVNDNVFAGYPKPISVCFPGVPDNLDSAVRYYWDNEIYFFKGEYYYKWSRSVNRAVGPLLSSLKWRNLCLL